MFRVRVGFPVRTLSKEGCSLSGRIIGGFKVGVNLGRRVHRRILVRGYNK